MYREVRVAFPASGFTTDSPLSFGMGERSHGIELEAQTEAQSEINPAIHFGVLVLALCITMYWWVNREWTPKAKECSDEATKKAQGLHGIVSPFYWDASARPNGRPNQLTDKRTENTKKSRDSLQGQ